MANFCMTDQKCAFEAVVVLFASIYNPDRLLRICPILTLRVWTEKKKLRIFGIEIFGVEF
jgi:hypothetical protein